MKRIQKNEKSETGKRLNVYLTPEAQANLEKLKNDLGVASHAEVIRRALKAYKAIRNSEVILRDSKTGNETNILFME